jgi:hypothetical protein
MTEADWLACADPEPMLEFLRGKATDRKLRLFACACCRHTWLFLEDDWKRMLNQMQATSATWLSRVSFWLAGLFRSHFSWTNVEVDLAKTEADLAGRALEVAERYAEGRAGLAELEALFASARDYEEGADSYAVGPDAAWTAKGSAYVARHFAKYNSPRSYPGGARFRCPSPLDYDREQLAQAHLLRDIFGNPLRPIAFDPLWQTPSVLAVAQTIYDDRRFEDLPILADALEEAGCTSKELLAHSRSGGEHVRGCWAVDLALDKE